MDELLIICYLLLFFVVSSVSNGIKRQSRLKFQFFGSLILLITFFCFRGLSVLNDTSHYYNDLLNRINDQSFFTSSLFSYNPFDRFEYGFVVYLKILVRYIWADPYAVIFFSGLIISISIVYLAYKHKVDAGLFVFLSFNNILGLYAATRQAIAVSISFVAYYFLISHKKKFFLFFALLAFLFHKSAIILLPLLFLDKLRNSRTKSIILIIVIVTFMPFIATLQDTIDSVYFATQAARIALPIAAVIELFLSILVLYSTYKLKSKYNLTIENEQLFWWIALFLILIQILSLNMLILTRYTLYFKPYLYIMFLSFYAQVREKKYAKNKLMLLGLISVTVLFFTMLLKNEWHHLIPYSFFNFEINNSAYYGY